MRGTILFCEKAHCHDDTGRYSLLGIFTSLEADQFPFWHTFTLWVWLAGGKESGRLAVIVDKDDEEAWFTYLDEQQIDFEGRTERFVALLAHRFCFPRPGTFRFRIEWNGTAIAEQWMSVTKT